jgi:hypothetical protein
VKRAVAIASQPRELAHRSNTGVGVIPVEGLGADGTRVMPMVDPTRIFKTISTAGHGRAHCRYDRTNLTVLQTAIVKQRPDTPVNDRELLPKANGCLVVILYRGVYHVRIDLAVTLALRLNWTLMLVMVSVAQADERE